MSRLQKLADELFSQRGMNEESVRLLGESIRADPDLILDATTQAANYALLESQRTLRAGIANDGVVKRYSKELQNMIQTKCAGFLDWPMMNGVRLADATKEHLITDAARFQRNADGNARNAAFLRAVADRLRDGQRVGDVLTERQLRNMMNRVKVGPGLVV